MAVHLITVATSEISDFVIERWLTSAKHFGYNPIILGRNERWNGFKTKPILFSKQLELMKDEDLCILTDSTDLFAVQSAEETRLKYKSHVPIVGCEIYFYAPGLENPEFSKKYFSPNYPNSGLIIGRAKQLRELMQINKQFEDDQTAVYKILIHDPSKMKIDIDHDFVVNVGNQKLESTNQFKWNGKFFITNKNRPTSFLHFPGKNWKGMKECWSLIFPQHLELNNEPFPTWSTWLVVGLLALGLGIGWWLNGNEI